MAVPFVHSLKDFTLSCTTSENPVDDANATEYFLENAIRHISEGKTTATTDTISGESYTFAQIVELSKNVASAFYKRGMRKGDIVIYMCYDVVKLHILANGIWRANGALRSVYPEELEDSILRTVIESKAKWIYCDETDVTKCLSAAQKSSWPVEVISTGSLSKECTSIYDLFQDDGEECPKLETKGEDPAIILSTSGTTGRSKGAVHSHNSVVNFFRRLPLNFEYGERNLFVSRGTHISGALFAMNVLCGGKQLFTMSRVSLENFFSAVEMYKPDWVFSFPAQLLALVNDVRAEKIDKSSVKNVYSGGTHVKLTLELELMEKLPNLELLSSLYGLTETCPLVSSTSRMDSNSPLRKLEGLPEGSMGKVSCGIAGQIRNESGTILGPNEEGELCVKSSTMISGYFKQEEERQKAFTPDGWFRTGDIFSYDENGFLYFRGRQKEMFKSSGYNHIFPVEIDEVISQHPSVADVCTAGVDDPAGEKMPRAFVVLKPGTNTTANEIQEFAQKNLPTYKHLRGGLYIVPELPKGTTGKIARHLVAQLPVPE